MIPKLKILVTGASPDNGNKNTVLRDYVADGFASLPLVSHVKNVPLEYASLSIEQLIPDVVICFGSCMPDDADYFPIRGICDKLGIPVAFWLHDDPYEFDYHYKILGIADFIFSNDKWCTEHYDHSRAFHLPLAACESAHKRPIQAENKKVDIFFCGVAFKNRKQLLSDLAPVLRNHHTLIQGEEWPAKYEFCKNVRLNNSDLSDSYNRARLTLNMGRDLNYANDRFQLVPSTPGPRTFEAAMAGTTQLYFVESLEIIDYYEPVTEIVLYNNAKEFSNLVDALLEDSNQCMSIASAAQQRTLKDHTYSRRAEVILSKIYDWYSKSATLL